MSVDYLLNENLENYLDKESPDVISESDLKSFFKCPHEYHLKHNLGLSKIHKSGFAAVAMFFENARRSLYRIRDRDIGEIFPFQTRAGADLKLAEEMNAKELRKYLAYGASGEDAFGNLLFGRWLQMIKGNEYMGSPLVWSYKEQSYLSGRDLQKAGHNYYRFVLKNGAPILGFINKDISFNFEGHKIKIKFPELHRGMIIDDISLWGFNSDTEQNKESKIGKSILPTLRILGYCTLAHNYPFYRFKWGISDEIAEEWGGNKVHISDKVTYRHFNATKNKITVTKRSDENLDLVRRALEIFLEAREKENFPVNHSSCNSCPYNVVDIKGKVICRDRKLTSKPAVPSYYFNKTPYEIKMNEEGSKITLEGFVRRGKRKKELSLEGEVENKEKKIEEITLEDFLEKEGDLEYEDEESKDDINKKKASDFLKPVNKFVLEYDEEGIVTSHYESEVRGLGFEDRMLMFADQRLIALSEDTKKRFIHRINFEKEFKGAGERNVQKMLKDLGYEGDPKRGYVKEYNYSLPSS